MTFQAPPGSENAEKEDHMICKIYIEEKRQHMFIWLACRLGTAAVVAAVAAGSSSGSLRAWS